MSLFYWHRDTHEVSDRPRNLPNIAHAISSIVCNLVDTKICLQQTANIIGLHAGRGRLLFLSLSNMANNKQINIVEIISTVPFRAEHKIVYIYTR